MKENDTVGGIVETLLEVNDLGVNEVSENGEEAFEVGEERRIVEGPRAGFVEVPLGERERVSESKPVAVDFEVSAVVGGDEEEL